MKMRGSINLCWGISLLALGVGLTAPAYAQRSLATIKPIAYSIAPISVEATFGEGESFKGELTFVITAANLNDTVNGTAKITLSENERQKLARITHHRLEEVPTTFESKDRMAEVQPGEGMPFTKLLILPFVLEALDVRLNFQAIELRVPGRETPLTSNSAEEIEALFTRWAIQVDTKRPRRGIIRRVNIVLSGEA